MKHLCLFLSAALLWACSSSEDTPVTPQIDITSPELPQVLSDNGGAASLSFTANGTWTAQADQSWCSVSPSQGEAGSYTLQISASANTDYDERNTKVIITCGTIKKEITITQKQKDAILLTSSKVEMKAEGGEISIELKSNVQYNYEIAEKDKEWIKSKPNTNTRGLTTSTLLFTTDENTGTDKREGHITISYGELSEEVTIYQEGMTSNIVLTQNEYTVSDAGEDILIELKSNVDYKMELPDVNWISEAKTRAMSSYSHRITIAPNEEYDLREAYITFINSENGVSEQVHIVQVQKDAIIVARNEYTLDYQASTLNFEVDTNVELSVESSATWIKQVKTRGLHTETLNFTIEENESEETREGVITVKNGEVKQEIKVSQKHQSLLSISQENFTVDANGGEIKFDVTSTSEYEIQKLDIDWIKEITKTKATTHTHTFSIAANESTEKREAIIVLKNISKGESKNVTVTQAGKGPYIIINPANYKIGSTGGEVAIKVESNIEYQLVTLADGSSSFFTIEKEPVNGVHYITFSANDSYYARNFHIYFAAKDPNLRVTATAVVEQDGKEDLNYYGDEKYTFSYNGGQFTVNFGTNVDLAIEYSADWMKQAAATSRSEYHDAKLTFDISANPLSETRHGIITLQYGNLKQEIAIIQGGAPIEKAGHYAIDLGLSIKWAIQNMGASKPEDDGILYGWADPTGEHTNHYTGEIVKDVQGNEEWKWMSPLYGGINPPANICGSDLDIANVQWRNGWRMPSQTDFEELKEKCQQNLIYSSGLEFIGPNGNRIFFPFCGWREGTEHQQYPDNFLVGDYWTGNCEDMNANWAGRKPMYYGIDFRVQNRTVSYTSQYTYFNSAYRSEGRAIRPVIE